MEPCHSLSTCPDEIQSYIYSFCGIKELGVLGLVSKKISSLVNSNTIWQTLCLREYPTLKRKENISWKETYRVNKEILSKVQTTQHYGKVTTWNAIEVVWK